MYELSWNIRGGLSDIYFIEGPFMDDYKWEEKVREVASLNNNNLDMMVSHLEDKGFVTKGILDSWKFAESGNIEWYTTETEGKNIYKDDST